MPRAYVALGSNVEPERHLTLALQAMRTRFAGLQLSPVYKNRAMGFEGDDFLNAVAGFDTGLEVGELKSALDDIEVACGRARGAARFAPRTLDLDLLLYGSRVDAAAKLPRPDILRYAFVLKPLADIAAVERHPLTGLSFAEQWAAFTGEKQGLTPVTLTGLKR